MKKIIALILLSGLLLAACNTKQPTTVDSPMPAPPVNGEETINTPEMEVETLNQMQVDCELSGGTYSNGECTCNEDELETYDGKYCITTHGDPGGTLGEEIKENMAEVMCENEGGNFVDGECDK